MIRISPEYEHMLGGDRFQNPKTEGIGGRFGNVSLEEERLREQIGDKDTELLRELFTSESLDLLEQMEPTEAIKFLMNKHDNAQSSYAKQAIEKLMWAQAVKREHGQLVPDQRLERFIQEQHLKRHERLKALEEDEGESDESE